MASTTELIDASPAPVAGFFFSTLIAPFPPPVRRDGNRPQAVSRTEYAAHPRGVRLGSCAEMLSWSKSRPQRIRRPSSPASVVARPRSNSRWESLIPILRRSTPRIVSYRGKSIFAFQCAVTISHSIEFTPNMHVADFIVNKSPNDALRRSIIFDRTSPLHR